MKNDFHSIEQRFLEIVAVLTLMVFIGMLLKIFNITLANWLAMKIVRQIFDPHRDIMQWDCQVSDTLTPSTPEKFPDLAGCDRFETDASLELFFNFRDRLPN